jgi:L-lactate dehydrogenase complex protein LldG
VSGGRAAIMKNLGANRKVRGSSVAPVPQANELPAAGKNVGEKVPDNTLEYFLQLVQEEQATVARVENLGAVPEAVKEYLQLNALPPSVHLAASPALVDMDWSALELSGESLAADGQTAVTGCYAGVAEAGALVTVTAPGHPAELNFLPLNHILVLPAGRVVGDFERLWVLLREEFSGRELPRCTNLIVGPSRTADLGVPAKLGAHGPARVHLILVEDG